MFLAPLIFHFVLTQSHAAVQLKKVDVCKTAAETTKTVLVIKQWHLPPKTVTKSFREKYPHEKNQTAIYKHLADAIKKKKVDLVVAEGCEGEINQDFKTAFNGWDYESLQKEVSKRNYEQIVSHVPLKLEARFGEQLRTLCGDSEKLIQEGNMRLSNLRGWMGFNVRLQESADPEKLKLYSESAAELLKVKRETPAAELVPLVRERLKSELEAFRKSLHDRNDAFVKVVSSTEFKTAAVVIGGLHAADLKSKLEAAGLGCEVLEPPGYSAEDEKVIEDFSKAVDRPIK